MRLFFLAFLSFLTFTCNKSNDPIPDNTGTGGNGGSPPPDAWLIPVDEVLAGGPGKDGIPSVDNPDFIELGQVDFMDNDDLILGIEVGGVVRGYPHPILDWHEIINDDLNGVSVAVTYCPLTGTGIGWDRKVGDTVTTFGVSGLLYNTNLIPYDRATDSHWSQIRLDCVNGELIETTIKVVPLIETTWATWKELFPFSTVVSTNTGFNRSYGSYPYGNYKTSNSLIFPVSNEDPALHKKERVLGVISGTKARAYRFDSFKEATVNIVHDVLEGLDLVVIGSFTKEFLVAYQNELSSGTSPAWQAVQDGGVVVAEDQDGNRLNIFGKVVEGPKEGEQLKNVESFMGYWFSWPAFYETSIYE